MILRRKSVREHRWPQEKLDRIEERNWRIWSERQTGETLASIGRRHALSAERIRTICVKNDRRIRAHGAVFLSYWGA